MGIMTSGSVARDRGGDADPALAPILRTNSTSHSKGGRPRTFAAGSIVDAEWSIEEPVALLLGGAASLTCFSPEAHSMRVGTFLAPFYFNLEIFREPWNLAFEIKAENDCEFTFGAKSWFHSMLLDTPDSILPLLESMIQLKSAFDKACLAAVTSKLKPRLAATIIEVADAGQDVAQISHEEIAEAVGASRPAVTRALSRMEEEGLVKTRRLGVELCNIEALVAAVG